MCDKNAIESILKELLETTKNTFPSNKTTLILFGSYARGDFDNDSDIDIMILADINQAQISKHRDAIDKTASRLSLKYGVTISIQLKDKDTFDKYFDVLPFYQNVWNEGVKYNVG